MTELKAVDSVGVSVYLLLKKSEQTKKAPHCEEGVTLPAKFIVKI